MISAKRPWDSSSAPSSQSAAKRPNTFRRRDSHSAPPPSAYDRFDASHRPAPSFTNPWRVSNRHASVEQDLQPSNNSRLRFNSLVASSEGKNFFKLPPSTRFCLSFKGTQFLPRVSHILRADGRLAGIAAEWYHSHGSEAFTPGKDTSFRLRDDYSLEAMKEFILFVSFKHLPNLMSESALKELSDLGAEFGYTSLIRTCQFKILELPLVQDVFAASAVSSFAQHDLAKLFHDLKTLLSVDSNDGLAHAIATAAYLQLKDYDRANAHAAFAYRLSHLQGVDIHPPWKKGWPLRFKELMFDAQLDRAFITALGLILTYGAQTPEGSSQPL